MGRQGTPRWFCVVDVSLPQTLHKLLLPMNSVVPKWNPHPHVSDRSRGVTFVCRSGLWCAQALEGTLLCPKDCSYHAAPSLPSFQRDRQWQWKRVAMRILHPASARRVFSLKQDTHGKCQWKSGGIYCGRRFFFKGAVTVRKGLARVSSKGAEVYVCLLPIIHILSQHCNSYFCWNIVQQTHSKVSEWRLQRKEEETPLRSHEHKERQDLAQCFSPLPAHSQQWCWLISIPTQ